MQYSDRTILKKGSVLAYTGFFIKGIIFSCIVLFIFFKLKEHPVRLSQLPVLIGGIAQKQPLWLLLLPLVLAPVNWLLEALKWQLLVSKIEKINLRAAFKGVLTGLSMGFITPHALGDYAGRIWQLKHAKRAESLGAIMLGRAMQYFATFTFGIFGAGYLFYPEKNAHFYFFSIAGIFIVLLLGVGVIICLRRSFLNLLNFFGLHKFRHYFNIITAYSPAEIIFIIALSFSRYLVFVAQFFLLLYLFDISADVVFLVAGISWTFLAKSTIPAFNFLSDLGVREFSALYFFSTFQVNDLHVVLASFALWAINILIPTFLGLIGVIHLKIFNKK